MIGALTELQRQPHLGLLPGLLLPDRTSVIPDAMAEFVDKHLRAC